MPVYTLDKDNLWFPSPEQFDGDVVALGGDLRPERMLEAYSRGIFPWYSEPGELMWWNPEYRCVLFFEDLNISHSMRNLFNKKPYRVTMDTAFAEVMEGCRSGDRKNATWLHDEVFDSYMLLHKQGLAHSVETWLGDELVGGLYGLCIGRMFFGESMFAKAPNASKYAFITMAKKMDDMGWKLLDCQVYNDHLGTLGACNMKRARFLRVLGEELKYPTLQGDWGKMSCFADRA
ncbi:MAG: leucyl/phenylalanyl-tRNA--protein transferase [Flavobacteriales bacterium]